MPDPILYLKASISAFVASAMIVLAFRLVVRSSVHSIAAVTCVLAVSVGLATGYSVLQFSWTWPPANSLNRFLTIVLPATLVLELMTGISGGRKKVSQRLSGRKNNLPEARCVLGAWALARVLCIVLRFALYASVGRILLHGSVYLDGASSGNIDAWTFAQTIAIFGGSLGGLIAVWSLLCRLAESSASGSIALSLVMVVQCTGLATMMAGYIKGGAAAFPLAAAVAGTSLLAQGCCGLDKRCLQGTIGIGVIGLFSLLSIGHYFGQLTSLRAFVLFLTPLLCWIGELPGLRSKPPWQRSAIRLIAVTIPVAAVLYFAKQDFDHKIGPLLAASTSPHTGLHLSSGSNWKPQGSPVLR